jgi:asparagine synthase (glutamine-hydrolysing)
VVLLSGSDIGRVPEAATAGLLWRGERPVAASADPGQVRVAVDHEEGVRLAVVGDCYASESELAVGLAAARRGQWRALTRWPGSYWVVVDDGVSTTVLTDVAGTKPVYYAAHSGGTAWASQASLVAALTGVGFDMEAVTTRMVCPTVTEVCGDATAYSRIRRVPAGHALRIGSGDRHVIGYEPLEEMLPFDQAADELRQALVTAVETRARASRHLSADFSGGLDSTSLALLAVRDGHPLLAITNDDATSANDDVRYARLLSAGQPLITHVVVPGTGLFFDRMDQAPPTDQPFTDSARWAMRSGYQREVLAYGSDLHLTGAGGDTLLAASPSYLADLVSLHPGPARALLRHAVGRARLRHLPVRTVVASAVALSRRSYADALRELAAEVRLPAARWERAASSRRLRWCGSGGLALWLTPDARAQLVGRIEAAAEDVDLGDMPISRHRAWSELREFGAYQAELAAQTRAGGVNAHAPLLDNQVVRAAMAISVAQRQSVQVQKPLLGAALDGLVPKLLLERTTKGAYDGNAFTGLRTNADRIRCLLEGSRLAAAGLVDLDPVRAELERLIAGVPGRLASLETLITTELWLTQSRPQAAWTRVERSHA